MLVNQQSKVYFAQEGYIRTAGENFTLDKSCIEKRHIHLTNNALQKYQSNYGLYEDGN